MAENVLRHIVPVQMLKCFCSGTGRLFCLRKDTVSIPDRVHGNSPRTILRRSNYYKAKLGDLDTSWIQPIERAFDRIYHEFATSDRIQEVLDRGAPKEFVDWALSQHYRTEQIERLTEHNMATFPPEGRAVYEADRVGFTNAVRRSMFELHREACMGRLWRWKCLEVDRKSSREFVVTDHPVCASGFRCEDGQLMVVPITKKRVILGGDRKALVQFSQMVNVGYINLFLAASAGRLVYSGSLEELDLLVEGLRGNRTPPGFELEDDVLEPYFGLLRRPAGVDTFDGPTIFEAMKQHYRGRRY